MTAGGEDVYPDLASKAAAPGFSLIRNHSFLDGNKRVGHAALVTFLVLNGCELDAPVAEAEQVILDVAASSHTRERFLEWVRKRMRPLPSS
jgi:death-on-curing protein